MRKQHADAKQCHCQVKYSLWLWRVFTVIPAIYCSTIPGWEPIVLPTAAVAFTYVKLSWRFLKASFPETQQKKIAQVVECIVMDQGLTVTESRCSDVAGTGGGIYAIGDTSMVSLDRSLVAGIWQQWKEVASRCFQIRSLTITNSTISGNAAIDYGGGINTRVVTSNAHSTIT